MARIRRTGSARNVSYAGTPEGLAREHTHSAIRWLAFRRAKVDSDLAHARCADLPAHPPQFPRIEALEGAEEQQRERYVLQWRHGIILRILFLI